MKRYIFPVLLICIMSLVLASCAGPNAVIKFGLTDKPVRPEPYLDTLKFLPDSWTNDTLTLKDSLWLMVKMFEYSDTAMYRTIRDINPIRQHDLFEKTLAGFKARKDLETFRGDTPDICEWWNEYWGIRAKYCFDFCRTQYFGRYLNDLAYWVIKLGKPDKNEWEEGSCITTSTVPGTYTGTCEFEYVEWTSQSVFMTFQTDMDYQIQFQVPNKDDLGSKRPMAEQMYGVKRNENHLREKPPQFTPFPEKPEPLLATMVLTAFPNGNDWYDVYLASRIPMKQLMQGDSTVGFSALTSIYDTTSHLVMPTDSISISVPSTVPDLEYGRYPLLRHYRLSKGSYSVWYAVQGNNEKQKSVFKAPVALPSLHMSNPSISEILLLENPQPSATFANRVVRNNIAYNARMSDLFAPGDSLYLYVEYDLSSFPKDNLGNYEYSVDVSIKGPIKEYTGPISVWQGPPTIDIQAVNPDAKRELQRMRNWRFFGEPLGTKPFPSAMRPQGSFMNSSGYVLPPKLKEGKYLITIRVSSLLDDRSALYCWREILVKKP